MMLLPFLLAVLAVAVVTVFALPFLLAVLVLRVLVLFLFAVLLAAIASVILLALLLSMALFFSAVLHFDHIAAARYWIVGRGRWELSRLKAHNLLGRRLTSSGRTRRAVFSRHGASADQRMLVVARITLVTRFFVPLGVLLVGACLSFLVVCHVVSPFVLNKAVAESAKIAPNLPAQPLAATNKQPLNRPANAKCKTKNAKRKMAQADALSCGRRHRAILRFAFCILTCSAGV
ncbi:MAG TPA: hypothetical protein VFI31_13560 [Pirellulales bacterium]|nr:hypothetical protein [Pirellulales bacterium]